MYFSHKAIKATPGFSLVCVCICVCMNQFSDQICHYLSLNKSSITAGCFVKCRTAICLPEMLSLQNETVNSIQKAINSILWYRLYIEILLLVYVNYKTQNSTHSVSILKKSKNLCISTILSLLTQVYVPLLAKKNPHSQTHLLNMTGNMVIEYANLNRCVPCLNIMLYHEFRFPYFFSQSC